MAKTVETRFWDKVDVKNANECWEWTASIGSHGYGQISKDGAPVSAHRLSWELHNSAIPLGDGYLGTCVLHTCDNKICVNPAHLFLGSNADNVADKVAKGRCHDTKGDKHGKAKLTNGQVLLIRKFCALKGKVKWTQKTVGKMFGVSPTAISEIKHGRNWTHLVGEL